MAASGSDSFSSGSNLSDTDIETINSEELVMFQPPHTAYSNKNDIVVVYSSGNAVSTFPNDWIGLFRTGWQTMYDFSAYQWVPMDPLHPGQPRKRRTVFPQADIGDLFGRFQFLYVTSDSQVIGVSDCFDVCGVDLVPESRSFLQECIQSSLSLISLGSLSSSSDENTSVDPVSENLTDVGQDLSGAVAVRPESSALVPQKDYWTLSDLVVGNRMGGLFQKLCFVQAYDWMSDYEMCKPIYLATDPTLRKYFIEEMNSRSAEDTAASSSGQTGASSESSGPGFSPLFLSGPLVFTYYPETLSSSQQSCLQMYHPKLLSSAVEETDRSVPAAAPRDREAMQRSLYQKWTLPNNKLPQQGSFTFQQLPPLTNACILEDKHPEDFSTEAAKSKQTEEDQTGFKFGLKWEGPTEDKKENSNRPAKAQQSETPRVSSGGTKATKQSSSTSGENTRKKRWVQRSNIKANRDKQSAMLQEAMTLLSTPSSSSSSHSSHATHQEPPQHEENTSSAPSHDSSRKRHCHHTPGVSKAKRRRLTRRTSTPTPQGSHEDEAAEEEEDGDRGVAEEDNAGINPVSVAESVELMSLALSEALRDNAQLRSQVRKARDKPQQPATAPLAEPVPTATTYEEKASHCEKPATSGKGTNTEKQRMCHAAANTKQTAKKDSLVQCGRKRKGKATNTEKKRECHVASNTTTVTKTDTPSQCVTSTVKSVNTLPLSSMQNASCNTPPTHPDPQSSTPPSPERRKSGTGTLSEIVPLDFTVYRVQLPTEDPEEHLSEWKKVSSKRMIRLQKLVLKKRQEFAKVRENAENFEKKARALETSLQTAHVALSVERAKRNNAENELRELRIKFWELLAFRRSQPWGKANPTAITVAFEAKPKETRVGTVSEPPLVDNGRNTPAKISTEEEHTTAPPQPIPLPESKANSQGSLTETSAPPKTSRKGAAASEESKTSTRAEDGDNLCPEHSSSSADKPRPRQPVPVLAAAAQINGVPVPAADVKKATCGSISFKKFLMPAMTALAETFTSKSSRFKATGSEEPTSSPPSTVLNTKPSPGGPFAKVTVSISAGVPSSSSSSAKSSSSSSKHQKTGSSRSKAGKRSNSRNKEKKAEDSATPKPHQETCPDSSSDITLRRRQPAHPPSSPPPPPSLDQKDVLLPSPIMLPFPKPDSSDGPKSNDPSCRPLVVNNVSEKGEEASFSSSPPDEVWRPLSISAADACPESERDAFIPAGVEQQPGDGMNSVSCQYSAGKGRPLSTPAADVASGKFTRNHFAKAVVTRTSESVVLHDVIKTTSSDMPDVIPSRGCGAFSWGKNTGQKSSLHPSLTSSPSSPFPCLFHHHPVPRLTTPVPLCAATTTPIPLTVPRLPHHHTPPPHPITTQPPQPSFFPHHATKMSATVKPLSLQPAEQQCLTLPPPRALHFDFFGATNDAVVRQIQQGRCRTCGMKFAPTVDRYLVEEHLYFHHAFTE